MFLIDAGKLLMCVPHFLSTIHCYSLGAAYKKVIRRSSELWKQKLFLLRTYEIANLRSRLTQFGTFVFFSYFRRNRPFQKVSQIRAIKKRLAAVILGTS
jgi:hypothetical protein